MPAFVLERFHWRRAGSAAWVRLPGEIAVGTFDTAEDAHAEQTRKEAEVRSVVGHPFRCGTTLAEFTTFPEYAFLDWLRDADLDPPDRDPDGRTPWLAWADLDAGEWTASHLGHIWEGCNRVRFFRVRERAGGVLHCVVRVRWSQNMSYTFFLPESEGGTPTTLWHDRPAADRDCAAKQALAADEMVAAATTIGEGQLPFDPHRRPAAADPFADTPPAAPVPVSAAAHCDVVEVERGEANSEPLGDTAFVVVRLGWEPLTDDTGAELPGLFDRHSDAGGLPVRVFARQDDAEWYRDAREVEYRAFANPYRFRPPAVQREHWYNFRSARTFGELGITPLPPDPVGDDDVSHRTACAEWWTHAGHRMTDVQRAAVWEHTWDYSEQLVLYAVRTVRVGDAGGARRRAVRTMYYVRATNWIPDGGPNLNPHRFLGAFTDRAHAEAVRDDAEQAVRTNPPLDLMPPLRVCEELAAWAAVSSMDPVEVGAYFFAQGLVEEAERSWCLPTPYWWQKNRDRFRPDQIRAAWRVFDRVRLYEVIALPTEVTE